MEFDFTKDSETDKPNGMQVTLDGNELSTAITDYMAKEGVVIVTSSGVFANFEECANATVVLAPEDIVTLSPTMQAKMPDRVPESDNVTRIVGDWIRAI